MSPEKLDTSKLATMVCRGSFVGALGKIRLKFTESSIEHTYCCNVAFLCVIFLILHSHFPFGDSWQTISPHEELSFSQREFGAIQDRYIILRYPDFMRGIRREVKGYVVLASLSDIIVEES